jgi:hypothetical protein
MKYKNIKGDLKMIITAKLDNNIIKINLDNIGFLKVIEEKEDFTKLSIQYRKKATLKEVEFILKLPKSEVPKFLARYKLYRLENYFININSLIFVVEKNENRGYVELEFYFTDGQYLSIKTNKSRWESWSSLRL